ncbi:MAG: peptidoglycan-binding protein [Coriobacteriia bacterium]
MRAVRPGDRGPAVEDIQRRLLALGYSLGPTGVDGVFLGETAEAVREFQNENKLAEDGVVGETTWSALVDAGFSLGDRMLYLKLPYFHGNDVLTLQRALNALGFACGDPDGILGTYCERAVREFQRNVGLTADGIVGSDTAHALLNLRHVWEGKDSTSHSEAKIKAARPAMVLARVPIGVVGEDPTGARVARRLVNLAHASEPGALMRASTDAENLGEKGVVFHLTSNGTHCAAPMPVVRVEDRSLSVSRLITALSASGSEHAHVVLELGDVAEDDEREDQRSAVLLLDVICTAFDRGVPGW